MMYFGKLILVPNFLLKKSDQPCIVFIFTGEGNKLPNPFDWVQVGRNLFAMFMLGILFFIINLLIEYNFFIKSR